MIDWKQVKEDELYDLLIGESKKPFTGWDFSYLEDRLVNRPLSWEYREDVVNRLPQVKSLLDMGTGGGEFLATLPLPQDTWATEAYAPNVPIAREFLKPLGVEVVQVLEDEALPLPDERFDLVINRHESYSPRELMRIMKPGAQFVTQQVGGSDQNRLNELLGSPHHEYAYWTLDYAVRELTEAGFRVLETREEFPVTRFADVGAVVYYLKAAPWQCPDFSVETHLDALLRMHRLIQEHGSLEVTSHRFFLIAEK